jgi:hypothetical protein
VQVVGADFFNGTPANLQSYRSTTGTTYPLLLQAANAASGVGNMFGDYGDRDNFAVVDPNGIVRYHAYDLWPYGNRYHRDEIRAAVNTWVGQAVGVGMPASAPHAARLDATPNPFGGTITFALFNPGSAAPARVTVHDITGRLVATAWLGSAEAGWTRVTWSGLGDDGRRAPAGVLILVARIGSLTLSRRIVHLE